MLSWNFENTYVKLNSKFFSYPELTPVKNPNCILFNHALACELNLVLPRGAEVGPESTDNPSDTRVTLDAADLAVLAGNQAPINSTPFSQAYCGHQFGHFAQLGDGRALMLGEHLRKDGGRFDVQLKGSGPTPYSRRGDGRAALGPMLREYLISEAMQALSIPTTRSLAVIATGEAVFRETVLPGAILCRIARSHIRVGTFEFASMNGLTQELLDFAIERHYPELRPRSNPASEFFSAVCKKQAHLIADWMLVGFIHGVMNTDNMLVSGETIDYGPCAFMGTYDPDAVFSSIDRNGRYAFSQQAAIGQWNLKCLAEALLPLCEDAPESSDHAEKPSAGKQDKWPGFKKDQLIQTLENYAIWFEEAWISGMGKKLGLQSAKPEDVAFMMQFLELLKAHKTDFTLGFRSLSDDSIKARVKPLWESKEFQSWKTLWEQKIDSMGQNLDQTKAAMNQINPIKTPRNYWVEEALMAAEKGELNLFVDLLKAVRNPYRLEVGEERFLESPAGFESDYQTFCGT